ncbi:MAG: hypothetical protein WAL84_10460 [Candidatus Dormiibacterota bacterium]
MAVAASLVCLSAALIATLAIGWRSRLRRRRGLLSRWGLPRAPRQSFASWGEVRSRLDRRVARAGTTIVDPKERDAGGER